MKNKKISGGAKAGSIIICIIMALVLSSTTTALILNRVFKAKFISSVVSGVVEAEIPVVVNGEEYDSMSEGLCVIIENCVDTEGTDISERDLKKFVEESGVEEVLTERIEDAIDAIIEGEDEPIFTEDDIMEFINDNEDLIEDTFDIEITRDVKDNIREEIRVAEVEETFTTGTIIETMYGGENDSIGSLINVFSKIFSTPVIIVGYVLVCAMFVGIFFLNKKQIWFAGPYLGIPTFIVGVGVTICAVAIKVVSGVILNNEATEIVSAVISPLYGMMIVIGIVYMSLGLVMTVASFVVKAIFKKNELKEQKVQEFV